MKWAKLRNDPDLAGLDKKELGFFKIYDSITPVAKRGEKGRKKMEGTIIEAKRVTKGRKGAQVNEIFNMWNRDAKPYDYPHEYGRVAREKYENFCGGWLAFYDQVVRNPQTDHILHLEWDKKKHKVTLWISPPAVERPETETVYEAFIKYTPALLDPPGTPPPPPPPRDP